MKLYIAYYEGYVTIIEGIYNKNKDKFNIKNCMFLSNEDVKVDPSDKYSLLKEALKINTSKVKDVVLCLNTKDIIIKSTDVGKVPPKDLDGIMNNEMDEIMSLDNEEYTFSYEVTKEGLKDDRENLNIVVAAILNKELDIIVEIFKDFKLNLERIDTMSTAYSRLLKKIEYDNMMILNVGRYGSVVNIFKEDVLFIHDNIPVKVHEQSNYYIYSSLVEEVRGLLNYYSSRNYGNNVDNIVIVGESSDNEQIKTSFNENFTSNIVIGIENLFDIEDDIIGDLNSYEISKVCDILGSMSICEDRKSYYSMNLLPSKIKHRQQSRNTIRKYIGMVPITAGIICAPYLIFGAMNMKLQYDINDKQAQLDEIIVDYKKVEQIKEKISTSQQEIDIYKMLRNKEAKWANVLDAINKSIPYKADLININVYYDSQLVENTEENSVEQQSEVNDVEASTNNEEDNSSQVTEETPIYDQVPNTIELEGEAINSYQVGQFVYNLNKTSYFESVKLKSTSQEDEKGVQRFNIVLVLKEGVVHEE